MAADARKLRAALRSKTGNSPTPPWVSLIIWAERFGVPPWQFEQELTGYWYHRIALYDKEVGAFRRQEETRMKAKRPKGRR